MKIGTLLGSYRIDDILGEGGIGIVYLATHVRLGRRVAIKALRPEWADSEQALRRFFAEARAVNRIAHPNIIEVTDFVEGDGDQNYYVMELLEGGSLAALLHHGGIPSLDRSVAIMTQLAGALVAVHDAGIVHRDLKPDNVVLVPRRGNPDFVKLVDFGLAKLICSDEAADERSVAAPTEKFSEAETAQGALLGTPGYMSPEQASSTPLDHRSDIYSFGVMLYELVTGLRPHHGSTIGEIVVALLTEDAVPPSAMPGLPHEVPQALDDLILACIDREPERRPASMAEVLEQLEAIAEEQGWLVYELNARPPSEPIPVIERTPVAADPIAATIQAPPTIETPRRKRIPVVAAVALAATLALAAGMARIGGGHRATAAASMPAPSANARIEAELEIADARLSAGRLVGPGGDEALDHLLAARAIDPRHDGVNLRLRSLASTFDTMAIQAMSTGNLAEAAAHLQAVLVIDPTNTNAAGRMNEIEEKMIERQRGHTR